MDRVRSNRKTTKFGTKFSNPSTLDSQLKSRFTKKQLGIGATAGFIGGSGYGYGSNLASYSVYHRYQRYRWYRYHHYHHHHTYYSYDDDDYYENYYSTYYQRNECEYGCPSNTHCEWGLCECSPGYSKAWGACQPSGSLSSRNGSPPRYGTKEGQSCATSSECQEKDINLVCFGSTGVCKCRRDLRWNPEALECQLFIDVDCKNVTYSSPVSTVVADAAKKLENVTVATVPTNRTETVDEGLQDSLISVITASNTTNVTLDDLNEAFCRDTEAFSDAFQVDDTLNRPENCQPLDRSACAVMYDSSTCAEGTWKLVVPRGTQKRLRYWSDDFKYRNDADVLGVRHGCSFTGWTGSAYNYDSFTLTAGATDRWVVFASSELYKSFDESILSFQCTCRS